MICYLIFHYQTISFLFEKIYPGLLSHLKNQVMKTSSDSSTAKRSAKGGHALVDPSLICNDREC